MEETWDSQLPSKPAVPPVLWVSQHTNGDPSVKCLFCQSQASSPRHQPQAHSDIFTRFVLNTFSYLWNLEGSGTLPARRVTFIHCYCFSWERLPSEHFAVCQIDSPVFWLLGRLLPCQSQVVEGRQGPEALLGETQTTVLCYHKVEL